VNYPNPRQTISHPNLEVQTSNLRGICDGTYQQLLDHKRTTEYTTSNKYVSTGAGNALVCWDAAGGPMIRLSTHQKVVKGVGTSGNLWNSQQAG